MVVWRCLISIVLGYLIGSIPVGYLVGRLFGVDVRKHGSGRTGGTNVYRAAGPWAAALTVLGDLFKGIASVIAARIIGIDPWIVALSGAAAVAGHNWPIFLGFRGGAGTITNLGVMITLSFPLTAILAGIGIIALILSRAASVASLAIAISAPIVFGISAALGHTPWAYVLYTILSCAMVVIALLPNIERLRNGEERKLDLGY